MFTEPIEKARGNVPKSELLYVRDIAERLGRSVAQINYMISTGQLPGTALVAGRRCIKESTLEAWIDAHFEEAA
ncbi:helix-turn-helix domain-containing protein [Nesterenkonia alba]|uniref:helix-turn-helix domain-containing protein n=1 Tax=Nesterenkonia alba TaxID=515814 RepID=UPI0003B5ABFD|nr:helix-turn-helix domain-containing protein [Nesterenkonia alba]